MSEWSRTPPPAGPEPRPSRSPRLLLPLAVAAAVALAAGFAGGFVAAGIFGDDDNSSAVTDRGTDTERRQVVDEESAVTDAVAAALPAVVTVLNDARAPGDSPESLNAGTGFIIDARGFVVTNEHVVRDSVNLRVILHDGIELPAAVVSHDGPFTDIAVVRIQPQAVEPLRWGDSSSLNIGQRVITVGSVLGDLRETVSVGVVSALGREQRSEEVLAADLIQTDAAINHGGSGGPLLTTSGEVVGINTTILRGLTATGNVEGIAFALASNTVRPIVEAIIERDRYDRPYVGIAHQDLAPAPSAQNGIPSGRGAIITRVTEGSPAADAGLLRGDIILAIDDLQLDVDLPFINALATLSPGSSSTFSILRDGREESVEVRVALRP
jgi:2-alkenal reductase